MQVTCTLPWDLDRAMTAFQVNPEWYEQYWLKPACSNSAFGQDHPFGTIDFGSYRARAARERALARQEAFRFLLALTSDAIRRVISRVRGG